MEVSMSEQNNESSFFRGLVLGAFIGSTVGAITALLFAPKPGKELRQDLALKSGEIYDKASDYFQNVSTNVGAVVNTTVDEGKVKAQKIITSAKKQAENLIENAEKVMYNAKTKANEAKEIFQDKIENFREAAKASAEAFRTELKAGEDLENKL
jgi:gas vesicle protein